MWGSTLLFGATRLDWGHNWCLNRAFNQVVE
jgi:hypothetical protein